MTAIEKLARRICWLEFASPKARTIGKTEIKYWQGVVPDKKREYEQDAEWLCWMLDRLARRDSSALLLNDARMKQRRNKGFAARGTRRPT